MFVNSAKIGVVLCWLSVWGIVLCLSFAGQAEPQNLPLPAAEENFYRQTRFGWQDCRAWQCRPRAFEETPVHPATTAILLLLGSLGVFVWASEEDEIAAMLGAPPPIRRSPSLKGQQASQPALRQSPL